MATATARDRLTVLQMRNPVAWTAITHHRTHKGEAMDFREAPCLLGLYADGSPNKTVMKATQAGATEYLICLTVVSAMRGLSVFYVLPTYQLVSRVVKNRFDPTIERTPFYGGHVRSEQGLYAGNVSLKHIGQGAVAFIGSNSRAGFTEFPADLLIVDELDECDQDNLNMAWERLGRSKYRWEVDVGNPTIPSFGIAAKYEASTKGRWAVWCDSCERFVRLDFFRNVVRHEGESDYRVVDETWEPGAERDCRVVCDCGKPINPKGRGRWESDHESSAVNGYHIDKLIAGRVRVSELIARLEAGIKSQAAMQRFWNGDLGLPFMAPGANIGHDDWNACIGTHGRGPAPGTVLVGIDVGSVFHVVTAVMGMDRLRIIQACELTSLRELMQHLKDYGGARWRHRRAAGAAHLPAPLHPTPRDVHGVLRQGQARLRGGQDDQRGPDSGRRSGEGRRGGAVLRDAGGRRERAESVRAAHVVGAYLRREGRPGARVVELGVGHEGRPLPHGVHVPHAREEPRGAFRGEAAIAHAGIEW